MGVHGSYEGLGPNLSDDTGRLLDVLFGQLGDTRPAPGDLSSRQFLEE